MIVPKCYFCSESYYPYFHYMCVHPDRIPDPVHSFVCNIALFGYCSHQSTVCSPAGFSLPRTLPDEVA